MKLAATALTTDGSENPATDMTMVSTGRVRLIPVTPFRPAGAPPTGTAGSCKPHTGLLARHGVPRMQSPPPHACAPTTLLAVRATATLTDNTYLHPALGLLSRAVREVLVNPSGAGAVGTGELEWSLEKVSREGAARGCDPLDNLRQR